MGFDFWLSNAIEVFYYQKFKSEGKSLFRACTVIRLGSAPTSKITIFKF